MSPPVTLDGRYIIVRGRLWRASNRNLPAARRQSLVDRLMLARRAVRSALARGDDQALAAARAQVQAAQVGPGERGPVGWTDGAPDLIRRLARTTDYSFWAGLGRA